MVHLIIQISIVSNRIRYLEFWVYFQSFKLRNRVRNLKLVKVSKFQTSILSNIQIFKLPKRVGSLKVRHGTFNNVKCETFKYTVIGLLIEAALSCKHDPHFVIVIIYHQDAILIKAMKYAFLNFLYLQILQLWILIMLRLSLTLMNMKNGAT